MFSPQFAALLSSKIKKSTFISCEEVVKDFEFALTQQIENGQTHLYYPIPHIEKSIRYDCLEKIAFNLKTMGLSETKCYNTMSPQQYAFTDIPQFQGVNIHPIAKPISSCSGININLN